MPGGFVGVDIFFVISGFLITSIICRNLEQDRFSFLDFYARRAKRIFPALMIVLVAAWVCGWLVLLTDEYEQLGKHIAAGAGFISNFALWQESGYFDKAAEYKPLLHLWSLGIEEQFYLLWPPLLVWAWKRKANLLNIACSIVAVSFVLNVMLVSLWQSSDWFYLPPTRFWELLLGGALAYVHLFRRKKLDDLLKRCALRADIQAALGLLLFVVAVAGLNKEKLFPGWWALLPTLSALLLISAGEDAWINRRLLSSRPLVFIGLISYPLYLWHWPLLSYANIVESGTPSFTIILGALALAFLLAWLTYRIVERPFRLMSNHAALVLIPSLAAVACLGLASFAHRFHARSEAYGLDKIVRAAGEWDFPGRLKPARMPPGYYYEQGGASPKVLFVGDSNMEQYYPRIDKLLTEHPDSTKGVFFLTHATCAPIPNVKEVASSHRSQCDSLVDRASSLAQDPDVDTVVIAAHWYRIFLYDQARYNFEADGFKGDLRDDPEARERAFQALEAMIGDYRRMGKQVYLILQIPTAEEFDPHHIVTRSLRNLGFKVGHTYVDRAKAVAAIEQISLRLMKIADFTGTTPIDPVNYLCPEEDCPTLADDGLPVYMDGGHLRPSYVREHAAFLDEIVSMR